MEDTREDRPLSRAWTRLSAAAAIPEEERAVAGRIGGAMWIIASLSIVALALVAPGAHRTALVVIGAAGCAVGVAAGLMLDFRRLPLPAVHALALVGTAAIAAAIVLSGGARSPAWACLFYVVVFAAYFFRPPVAAGYFLACVLVEALVAASASPGSRSQALAKLVVAAPAFIVLGAALVIGKRFLLELRRRAERLAAEQSALRRVATAVVGGQSAEAFYRLVAAEAGRLMEARSAGILRLAAAGEATILGSWARDPEDRLGVGERLPVPSGGAVASDLAAGRPVEVADPPPGLRAGAGEGAGSSILAPIRVAGRLWGFLAVVADGSGVPAAASTRRLNEFADLIATSVASIEDRAALAAQAATDALTGVANHRTFHQRLSADLARSRRYGSPVSVVVIDVDHFKDVNDTGGHEAGDEMLKEVARRLSEAARTEDTVARIGGDEFAWILPETTGEEALAAVERARRAIIGGARKADGAPRITISAGVCDSGWTADAAALVRLADRALYYSKEHGRNQVRLYAATSDELAPVGPRN